MSRVLNGVIKRSLRVEPCHLLKVPAISSTLTVLYTRHRRYEIADSVLRGSLQRHLHTITSKTSLSNPSQSSKANTQIGDYIFHQGGLFSDALARATKPQKKKGASKESKVPNNVRHIKAEYEKPPPKKTPEPKKDPKSQQESSWITIQTPTNRWLALILFAANTLIFIGWQYAHALEEWYGDPLPSLFMSTNFLFGPFNLDQGRWWTLFTSSISQEQFGRYLGNMVALFFLSPPILLCMGPMTFLGLYFGACAVANVASIGWKRYITPILHKDESLRAIDSEEARQRSQGATGCVLAILTSYTLLFPSNRFLSLRAWIGVSSLFIFDLVSAMLKPENRLLLDVDNAGHLGGYIAGTLFWWFRLRGIQVGRDYKLRMYNGKLW